MTRTRWTTSGPELATAVAQASMGKAGDHAIVVGASMAGLLSARVLADAYRRVTIIERDPLPAGESDRKGVPQGRHAHALLPRGAQILDKLFPGLLVIGDGSASSTRCTGRACVTWRVGRTWSRSTVAYRRCPLARGGDTDEIEGGTMQPAATPVWVMTVEYSGVLPSGCEDEGDPGDSRVRPLAISKMGEDSTRLSAFVAAGTEQQAGNIGLAGIGRWAEQIGLDTGNPIVVSLFPRDTAS